MDPIGKRFQKGPAVSLMVYLFIKINVYGMNYSEPNGVRQALYFSKKKDPLARGKGSVAFLSNSVRQPI
jgi:hypothetical protein